MARARKENQEDQIQAASSLSPPKALVFVSHDTRDAALAAAFSTLLSNVTCGMLKSFRSSDKSGTQGLEYGSEWYPEIMSNINQASDVVCLLTQHSVGRPWILYEAGVAKGKLDTPVHGLALGIPLAKAAAGPFAQFQNCDGDAESVGKLVTQLARRLPNADPPKSVVEQQVLDFCTKAEAIVRTHSQNVGSNVAHQSDEVSAQKLFEEVKVMFQELLQRNRTPSDSYVSEEVEYKQRRAPIERAESFTRELARAARPSAAWLMATSQFKDDFPWAHQLGLRVYQAAEGGRVSEAVRVLREYKDIMSVALNMPAGKAMFRSDESRVFFVETFERLVAYLRKRQEDQMGLPKK